MKPRHNIGLLFFLLSALNMKAAVKTWDGDTDSNYGNGANWDAGTIPGAADDVIIVGGTPFAPTLDAIRTCRGFTMTSGTFDLGGFTLTPSRACTFTAGTITNGTFTVSNAGGAYGTTFTNTTFNNSVTLTVTTTLLYLNGGTFHCNFTATKSGATATVGTGGCTFNGTFTLTVSSTGDCSIGSTTASTFNSTCDLNITNTADIYLDRTTHNGNITADCNNASGVVYFGNTAACNLASTYTLAAGGSGFSAGALKLKNFTQSGTTAQTITLTGTAEIWFETGTIFNGNITITAPAIYFNGATFQGTSSFDQNGATNISSAGGCTFNGPTTLLCSGAGQIWMAHTTAADDFNSDVSIQQPNTPGRTLVGNTFGATIAGNLTFTNSYRNYCIGCNTGAITFDGTGTSTIYGDGVYNIDFENLHMGKTGAGSVVLATPIIVSTGQLWLSTGVIYSDATNYLLIDEYAVSPGASGGSANSYVDGPLIKEGNYAFTFPVGDAGFYSPITISAPSVSTDRFKAQYFYSNPGVSYNRSSLDATLLHVSQKDYWILDRTAGTSNVTVTLSWNTHSGGIGNLAELRVSRWDAATTKWKDHGNGGTTGNTTTGTVVSSAAVTSFSPFALASTTTNNPLPVDLLLFDSQIKNNNTVKLFWQTASEINSDYFEIQRSADLDSWKLISKVPAAGNSSSNLNYETSDPSPMPLNYYRLKQVDKDGSASYYGPLTEKLEAGNDIIWNIVHGSSENAAIVFSLHESAPVSINILDLQGKVVNNLISNTIYEKGNYQLPIPPIASGVYLIKLNVATSVYIAKLLIF